jgi:hypothetical protein
MKKIITISIFISLSIPLILSAQEQKDDFKPSGKFCSQVFGDYYYVVKADTGILNLSKTILNKKTNANGFRLRRANLSYEYNFAPNLTSMVKLETEETSVTSDGKMDFFLKDASIKWSFIKNHDLIIGLQSTFTFEESEKNWGHRYIERTIMDIRGIASSRDLGISLRGKITDNGSLFYNIMVANNSALKTETDKYKRFYANIGYRPIEALCITLYGDYSAKERIDGKSKNEMVSGLFMGYKKEKVSIGIEGFYKISQNGDYSSNELHDLYTSGSSIFGSYKFAKKWGSFARFDLWDNNITISGDARNFATAGITWSPINGFTLSPNLEVETYEKNATRTPAPSIWARLTFHWQIK